MPLAGRRYRRLKNLAASADRVTMTAVDELRGEVCVLKVARADSLDAQLLQEEGRRLASLRHPALVRVSDHLVAVEGVLADVLVTGFATEWIDGHTLSSVSLEVGKAERLQLFAQLVEVVEYLHRFGLLHLDIKPDNVMVRGQQASLLDLGTARPLTVGVGEAGGTLGYAAPEVLLGEAAGPGADVFSLGVLLYELLSGRSPFEGSDGASLRDGLLAGHFVPLLSLVPDLDPAIAALCERMFARDVTLRPADLRSVRQHLEELGVRVPPRRGEPPLVGREAEQRALLERLSHPGEVWLVGPEGSGRRRLTREVLPRVGVPILDLSERPLGWGVVDQVVEQLVSLKKSARTSATSSRNLGPCSFVVVLPSDESETVSGLVRAIPTLVDAGASVLRLGTAAPSRARSIRLGPLEPAAILALGLFFGRPLGLGMPRLLARTAGWPRALVQALREEEPPVPAALGAVWSLVCGLPDGIPAPLAAALPLAIRMGVDSLAEQGFLRAAPDGRIYALRPGGVLRVDDRLRAILGQLVELPGLPTLWCDVLRLRLGLQARDFRPERIGPSPPHDLIPELTELTLAEAERGSARGRHALALLALTSGDSLQALELLGPADQDDAEARERRLMALRNLGRHEEFLALLGQNAVQLPPLQEWIARTYLARQRGSLEEFEQALASLRGVAEGDDLPLVRVFEAQVLIERQARGLPLHGVDELLAWFEGHDDSLPAYGLSAAGRLAGRLGDLERQRLLLARAVRMADQEGDVRGAAGIRLNLAGALIDAGDDARRRSLLEEAALLASAARQRQLYAQCVYNLARTELHAGRLPDARARIAEFARLVADLPGAELRSRGALNRAWLCLSESQPTRAIEELAALPLDELPSECRRQAEILRGWALVESGEPAEALALLPEHPSLGEDPHLEHLALALRGRALLAMGRSCLDRARRKVLRAPSAGPSPIVGEVLLAWGGEDQDPSRAEERREALEQATLHLRGALAGRAIRQRARLTPGGTVRLDGIVSLTESLHDAKAFPQALARLVREALGVHRVLIMLRMPGLGNQVGFTELSGSQAAGIGREVMQRIKGPDDVWRSGDAFADPGLRRSSQTVRTFEIRSLLAVAIPGVDRAIGALYIDDITRANRFEDEDVAMLQRLGRAIAGMIPLVNGEGRASGDEPVEILGTLLSSPPTIRLVNEAIEMLRLSKEANVMITGPTGAGKTVLARRLAIEVLKCSDMETIVLRKGDPQMLVTMLQGSQRGEFTGAADREGAITRCLRENKALFLDEVQNLDEAGQQILLPLLDIPRSFGGLTTTSRSLHRPLHVLLGTNHDISEEHAFEVFRADLWYRMSRIHIHLPPLRERGVEVVYRYLAGMLAARGAPPPEEVLEPEALQRVTSARWPGNLRELEGFAERVALLAESRGRRLGLDDLPNLRLEPLPSGPVASRPAQATLEQISLHHIMETLRSCSWQQRAASVQLGMAPPTLNKLLRRHGLLDEVKRRRNELS